MCTPNCQTRIQSIHLSYNYLFVIRTHACLLRKAATGPTNRSRRIDRSPNHAPTRPKFSVSDQFVDICILIQSTTDDNNTKGKVGVALARGDLVRIAKSILSLAKKSSVRRKMRCAKLRWINLRCPRHCVRVNVKIRQRK